MDSCNSETASCHVPGVSTSPRQAGSMPRRQQTAADREVAEIEELSRRVLDEAPQAGANVLDTDDSTISTAKASFGSARKFSDLPISARTLAGLAQGNR